MILTTAGKVCDWTEAFTKAPEGLHVGQYIVLLPFQREELHRIYNNRGGDGYITPEDETRLFESLLFDRFGDKPALALALERCRQQSPERDRQISKKLALGQSVLRVSAFCSYVCQMQSLGLLPYEVPPCHVDIPDTDVPKEQTAAKLLWRMVDAGVSKYHPNPLRALDQQQATA